MFYLMEGSQYDWQDEQRAMFHKQAFMYVNPYIGMDYCMTEKVHLTFRLDWLIAIHHAQIIMPTGPRLYVGFMFCH